MTSRNGASVRRFVVIAGNRARWGGSEELWCAAAGVLASEGHHVVAFKAIVDDAHPRVRQLRAQSCRVHDLDGYPLLPPAILRFMNRVSYSVTLTVRMWLLSLRLILQRPDLVIISQGGNDDGSLYARVCRRLGLPYVVIAHKATEMSWPTDDRVPQIQAMYTAALRCLFVSEHNLRLTEYQIGAELPHAVIVRNPFFVPWKRREDWPGEDDGLHLACVARLCVSEKGQDVLLHVLAQEKWRARRVMVTFYGEGAHRATLEKMTRRLGLTNVSFGGQVEDPTSIWERCHALVLSSRCEGMPLVLVEAMLSGRVPIVTNVGGNGELVVDEESGFLASSPTESEFDETMERAWSRRSEWRVIGERAADRIRTLIPPDPVRSTVDLFTRLAQASRAETTSSPPRESPITAQL